MEAANFWHVLLHPEMVTLNALLEMLGHIMHGIWMQKPLVNRRFDRRWEDIGTVNADLRRGEQWLVLQHLAEKPLGGIEIALGSQQKIDRMSTLVDGPVQISPFAADLHIGLIDAHRAAMWPTELTQPLLDDRRVGQNPAVDGAMIDLEATFPEHLLKIAIAERITQIPTDSLHNQPCLEMPSFEVILRLTLQLLGNGIQNHQLAPQYQERQFLSP
ncbi:hypothetical protein JOH51_001471 [Rhizobium leguminosarum]|nr:hypothetical protein [Rhizobium leguminosarum]